MGEREQWTWEVSLTCQRVDGGRARFAGSGAGRRTALLLLGRERVVGRRHVATGFGRRELQDARARLPPVHVVVVGLCVRVDERMRKRMRKNEKK